VLDGQEQRVLGDMLHSGFSAVLISFNSSCVKEQAGVAGLDR